MEVLRDFFSDPEVRRPALAIGYVLAVLVLRALLRRAIFRTGLSPENKLRWRAQLRNATVLAILLGLTLIWAEELRTLAFSVIAIAAAIAITTKEITACFLGSVIRASGRGFEIGDRVQIGDMRGDVIDIGPMTTSLLEIGPIPSIHSRTGRVVTLPNSVFLTASIFNETMTHHYVLHIVRVPMLDTDDWEAASARLERLGRAASAKYYEDAAQSMVRAAQARGVAAPRFEPGVYVDPVEPGRVDLLLRVPTPVRERDAIGQSILRRFLRGEDAATTSSPAADKG